MKRKKVSNVDLFSVPPGFVVISYEPDTIEPSQLIFSSEMIDEWKARGYFGGIIIPEGTDWKSYSDEQLKELGLQRIQGIGGTLPPPDML